METLNVEFTNDAKERESSFEAKIDQSFGTYPYFGNVTINAMAASAEESKEKLIEGLEGLKVLVEKTIEAMNNLSGFSYGVHVIYNLDTGKTEQFKHGFYKDEMFEYCHVTVGNPDRIMKIHVRGNSTFNVMPTVLEIAKSFKPTPTVFGYYNTKTGEFSHRSDGSAAPLPAGSPMVKLD